MNRLEEIRIRAKYVDTQIPQGLNQFPIDTAVELAADTLRLVKALEAVLALPTALSRDMHSTDYNRGLFAAKRAIREALGETT